MLSWAIDTDARLVRRTLAGRSGAFEALVERYYPAARAIGLGITRNTADAEDVAQEAFLQAYLKLPSLQEPRKFAGWLGTISRNAALRILERRTRESAAEIPEERLHVPPPAHAEQELARLAAELLEQLDDDARDTLWLHYFGGYSAREIAAMQGVSRDAALKRLQRAREALGERLLSRMDAPPSRRAVSLRQKQSVVAAVAASGLLYGRTAAAATAMASAGGFLGMKAASWAGLGLVLAAILSLFGALQWRTGRAEPPKSTAQASVSPATVAEEPKPEEPAAPEAEVATATGGGPGQAEDDTSTGDGTIYLRVFDAQNRPVAGAQAVVERVEWPLELLPPAKTVRRSLVSDAEGRILLEGLPQGSYGVFVWTKDGVDATSAWLNDHQTVESKNLYLKPGLPVAGRLVDESDAPIAGAYLFPTKWNGDGIIGEQTETTARQVTDANGNFSFPALLPGTWTFYVQPRDRAGGEVQAVAGDDEAATLVLPTPGRLEGHCEWEGEPGLFDEARIEVFQASNPRATRGTPITADGRFVFEAVAAGDYVLNAVGPRIALEKLQTANVASGRTSQLTLAVSRGHDLHVNVKDDAGAPVAGAKLSLSRNDDYWRRDRDGITDSNGTAAFTALNGGKWNLVPRRTPGYAVSGRYQVRDFTFASDEHEKVFEMTAVRGVPVTGRVLDKEGTPVQGALVEFSGHDGSKEIYLHSEAVTSGGGTFLIDDARPLSGARIKARKGGWASAPQTVDIAAEGASGLGLTLDVEAITALEVRLPGAEPDLLGLNRTRREVVLTPLDAPESIGMEPLDAGGRCVFTNVPVGQYKLHIQDESGGLRGCGLDALEVTADKDFLEVDLTCGNEGDLEISGRVVDLRGAPIAGAEITAGTDSGTIAQASSDAGGRFRLEGLPDGIYFVKAESARQAPAYRYEVAAGTNGLELVMEDRCQIKGRVLDGKTRQPLAGAELIAQIPFSDSPTVVDASTTSGDDGHYTLDHMTPGDLLIHVKLAGYMTAAETVPLAAGETAEDIEFLLSPAITLHGRVTNSAGEPIANAKVSCGLSFGQTRSYTNADGVYEITLDDAAVQISAQGYVTAKFTAPEAGGEHDVTLMPTGRIAGEILHAEEVPYLSVSAEFSDGSSLGAEIRDGKFTLGGAAGPAVIQLHLGTPMEGRPGSYQILSSITQTAEIVAGQEVPVVFDLSQRGNASMSVEFVGGEPPTNVRISASEADVRHGNSATAQAVSAYEYVFEGLVPARYTIYMNGGSGMARVSRTYEVDIAAGVNPPLLINLEDATGSLAGTAIGQKLAGTPFTVTITADAEVCCFYGRLRDDGSFRVEGLPAGRGNITVSAGGMRGKKGFALFEIRAGEETNVVLNLGGECELEIERADSSGWMSVSLLPAEAREALSGISTDALQEVLSVYPVIGLSLSSGQNIGRFEGLPAGEFLVVVSGSGAQQLTGGNGVEFYPVTLAPESTQHLNLP